MQACLNDHILYHGKEYENCDVVFSCNTIFKVFV